MVGDSNCQDGRQLLPVESPPPKNQLIAVQSLKGTLLKLFKKSAKQVDTLQIDKYFVLDGLLGGSPSNKYV